MENPGAVTVNDSYIFKDKVAKGTRSHLVTMVAHELCHMWFGDFVTMDWWDGLWLNESFADFLSFYACE
jgi:aminopeptidase N